jgi:hypothetical protein
MKKISLLLLLLTASHCWAGPKPDPSQYTVNVHVSSSLNIPTGNLSEQQQLQVTIDGKKYVLQGGTGLMVLKTGDYRARVLKEETNNPVEYSRSYEFLFPNGETRKYYVYGEEE